MPLIVENKTITTPIQALLKRLQEDCQKTETFRLSKIDDKGNEATVQCPIHKGGHENNPSCGVLLTDKQVWTPQGTRTIPAGTAHCFTCGYSAGFIKFVADCLGCSRLDAIGWVLSVSDYEIGVSDREIYSLDFAPTVPNNYNDFPLVSAEELRKYEFIHPYMFKRKLTDEIIRKFDVGYDPATDSLTFPVFVDGRCLFVAKRKVREKVFLMPPLSPKPIYGLDYLTENEVIVCESVINALTCWVYGKQAVALFGTGSDYQIEQLQVLPQRKIILALDGDEAGRKATKKIKNLLTNKIIQVYNIPTGKDINDLSKEEFERLKEI